MDKYEPKEIEQKWQKKWQEDSTYKAGTDHKKEKCYVLDMFPYPSGEGLHVGHPKGYIATDIYSRYKRMKGLNVLHPMGWDAFGLPAENYALKNKVHPRIMVDKNVLRFKEQLDKIGLDYDWSREVNTTDPAFYKWTQWIFLQMYKKGLAYESNEPINWCPSCQTGLANEDLEKGKCERCGSDIEKRPIRQWVLKITDYADRLLEDIDGLNWPENIKQMQREWIGRSEGMIFKARVKDLDLELETFSAHFEACFADTFVVIAPDHPLLAQLLEGVEDADEIRAKIVEINLKRMEDKYAGGDVDVEGVFTGRYLVDPPGNGDLPIWVASYALLDYGTGIVKCSAHDVRDFAFAKKYGIPLKVVLVPEDEELRKKVENLEVCYADMQNGILLEPLNLSHKSSAELRDTVSKYVIDNGWAKKAVKYKLRDWVFSRQRYWGEPIPLIHCNKCGVVPVPESELPVRLPEVEHYEPTGTGESPLANIAEWVNVKCPRCKGEAKRETNTMPQWAGSSWYWLRFMDQKNSKHLVDKKLEEYWSPVDLYVGGAEHATRHLIYARFYYKFLFDIGVVNSVEPFTKLISTGLIMASDGRKMSKRWGNVINPDDVIAMFGADTFRLYEMFLGPFSDSVSWNDDAVIGPRRFLERVWRLFDKVASLPLAETSTALAGVVTEVSDDIEMFKFNTAIPKLMKLATDLGKQSNVRAIDYQILVKLLAPFAPCIAEELWERLGQVGSVHQASWPLETAIRDKAKFVTLPVQVDGKLRGNIYVDVDIDESDALKTALNSPVIAKWLNVEMAKVVAYKPGRILSIESDSKKVGTTT